MIRTALRTGGLLGLLLVTALIAAVAAGSPRAGAGGNPHVWLDPMASSVDFDDGRFTIRVRVSDVDHHGSIPYDDDRDTVPDRREPSEGLAAFEVILGFDPGVIEIVDVDAGGVLLEGGRTPQCFQQEPRAGEHAFACVSFGSNVGVQGSGLLATITLRPRANGMTFLAARAALSGPLGDPIPADVDGGVVDVSGAPSDAPPRPPLAPDGPDGVDGSSSNDGDGDGNADPPSLLDGNRFSDIVLPGGNGGITPANRGASGDPNGTDEDFPGAGTGYEPPAVTWPLSLAGALLATGAALLLLGGLRLTTGARR